MAPSSTFSIEGLEQATQAHQARIEKDPSDTGLRLNLAWMLMLQSSYAAGREAGRGETHDGDNAPSQQEQGSENAAALLKNCLHQVSIVAQLSASTQEKLEAEKLRSIITLANGQQAVLEADRKAAHTMMTVMRSLVSGKDTIENR